MSESVREGVGEDLESWIMYIDHTYCIEQLKQFAVFLLTHTQTTLKTTPLPFPPLPSSPFPSSPPLPSPPQVSAWGGYVFIINLIPLHIFALLLMGRYSSRIYVGECRALCRLVCMNTHQGSPSPYSPPLPCPSPAPPLPLPLPQPIPPSTSWDCSCLCRCPLSGSSQSGPQNTWPLQVWLLSNSHICTASSVFYNSMTGYPTPLPVAAP